MMEIIKNICYYTGAILLGSVICSLILYGSHRLHSYLHKKFLFYKRSYGLLISFPFSVMMVLFFSKRKSIITYGGWYRLEQDQKQIFEYMFITNLLKRKAAIKSNLEYAQAQYYLEKNKGNTVFSKDYGYRVGLTQTVEDFKSKLQTLKIKKDGES